MEKKVDCLIVAFNRDIALEISQKVQNLESRNFFEPSGYQRDLINFVVNGNGNGLVQAVAGSGKTTTILQALNELRKKYQTKPLDVNEGMGTYPLLDYGNFSIYPTTQHGLALKILKQAYPKIVIDHNVVISLVKEIFTNYKTGDTRKLGAWYTDQAPNQIYEIKYIIAQAKALSEPTEVDQKILDERMEKNFNLDRNDPLYFTDLKSKKLSWEKDVTYLFGQQQSALLKLVGAMLSAGVGLRDNLPIDITTARKIYTEFGIEPKLSGFYAKIPDPDNPQDKITVARYTQYTVDQNGNRIPPQIKSLYDMLEKDKICYYAVQILTKLYNMNNLTKISFDLVLYKVVQNYENKIVYPSYDFIFQDEAQDTNFLTMMFLSRLLKPSGRIIGVGDVAQAIYGFRGANSYAMREFQRFFNCTEMPLSTCYRCARTILDKVHTIGGMYENIYPTEDAPSGLVGELKELTMLLDREITIQELGQDKKPIKITDENGKEKLKLITIANPLFLGKEIFNKDTAIIGRTNNSLSNTARLLRISNIPYNLVQNEFEASIESNESQGEEADEFIEKLKDILNKLAQMKKIKTTVWNKFKKKYEAGWDWNIFNIYNTATDSKLTNDQKLDYTSINRFMQKYRTLMFSYLAEYREGTQYALPYDKLQSEISAYIETYNIMYQVLKILGQNPFDSTQKSISLQIKPLIPIIKNILRPVDKDNAVTLVTAHKSKGLEYHKCFVLWDTFNHEPSKPYDADIDALYVQERNMLYVALTRAEKELIIVKDDRSKESNDQMSSKDARYIEQLILQSNLPTFDKYDPNFELKLEPSKNTLMLITKNIFDHRNTLAKFGNFKDISGRSVAYDDPSVYKYEINLSKVNPIMASKFDTDYMPIVVIRIDDGAVIYEKNSGLKFTEIQKIIDDIENSVL